MKRCHTPFAARGGALVQLGSSVCFVCVVRRTRESRQPHAPNRPPLGKENAKFEQRLRVRSCNRTFRGEWRGSGSSGLSGLSCLSGLFGLFGSTNERDKTDPRIRSTSLEVPSAYSVLPPSQRTKSFDTRFPTSPRLCIFLVGELRPLLSFWFSLRGSLT